MRGTLCETAFTSIENLLRAEEGIANELDWVEQTSWVLFLKYLHDLESGRRDEAELNREAFVPIIDGVFRCDRWAARKSNGQFDHTTARIGDDLIRFVDGELFPYLASFRERAGDPGRSMQNGFVKSFNGRMRDECLTRKSLPICAMLAI